MYDKKTEAFFGLSTYILGRDEINYISNPDDFLDVRTTSKDEIIEVFRKSIHNPGDLKPWNLIFSVYLCLCEKEDADKYIPRHLYDEINCVLSSSDLPAETQNDYKQKFEELRENAKASFCKSYLDTYANLLEFYEKNFIGSSPCMIKLKDEIFKAVFTENPWDLVHRANLCELGNIFIEGPSGSGKEVAAQAIGLGTGLFASKNFFSCSVIEVPGTMIDNFLFGSKKGFYTGSTKDREGIFGRFLKKSPGYLFIDEIGELEPDLQSKLLRTIQEKKYMVQGDDKYNELQFRLITASNKDLKNIPDKEFRKDLYFRIASDTIKVPPLNERNSDIKLLILHFLKSKFRQSDVKMLTKKVDEYMNKINGAMWDQLENRYWQNNVRELQSWVEILLHDYKKAKDYIQHYTPPVDDYSTGPDPYEFFFKRKNSLEDLKRGYTNYVKSRLKTQEKSAVFLGVSRGCMINMLKENKSEPGLN